MPDAAATPASGSNAAASYAATPHAVGRVVVVAAAVAPLQHEARVASAQDSQALRGHALLVHEVRGDWLRVAGLDGYAAWVHAGYVRPAADVASTLGAAGAERPWLDAGTPVLDSARSDRAVAWSLGCTVVAGGTSLPLPLGALVERDDVLAGGDVVTFDQRAAAFPPVAAAAARTAVTRFAGSSYLWGGATPWGCDCSGLVQGAFALHGLPLPRDAWQQALAGEDAGTDPASTPPGTLLFFSEREDRRVTHVAVSLGGQRLVHSALGRGGQRVERLDDTGDPYVVALLGRFTNARRI